MVHAPLVRSEDEESHVATAVVDVTVVGDEVGEELLPDVSDSVAFGAGADGVARRLIGEAGSDVRDREDGFHDGWLVTITSTVWWSELGLDVQSGVSKIGSKAVRRLFRRACLFIVGKATIYLLTIRN